MSKIIKLNQGGERLNVYCVLYMVFLTMRNNTFAIMKNQSFESNATSTMHAP